MTDLNQKPSDTDKRIAICLQQRFAIAFRHSIWLTYLLTLGTISAGGLSIFSIATLLKTNPAQANEKEQAATSPAQIEESNNSISLHSSEATSLEENQTLLAQQPSNPETQATSTSEQQTSNTETQATSTSEQKLEQVIVAQPPTAKLPTFTAQNQSPETEFQFASEATVPALNTVKSSLPQLTESTQKAAAFEAFQAPLPENTSSSVERISQIPLESTQKAPAFDAFQAPLPENTSPSVERISQIPLEPKANPVVANQTPNSTVYKGPGSAALLEGTLQAQSSRDTPQQTPSRLETAPQNINPLAPTLVFQGVVINQGDTSARARLTGIYPFSPNALVGGTAEVGTGPDFSDPQAGSFRINELYFSGNLPSYPNLRLTAGLVDLTSYFDRNSFAKDAATHFFNPVFQTNPALSATGLGSRPAALLNWNITDNIEAKAAGFSSAQSIGDFGLDAFAGELGFRVGNGIIRATYATGRDVERNGFQEIYGIPRSPGETGPRSSDRESSYGINGEYFFPEIKMGVFGRYGRYENTSIGRGGDTYSVGLNFLDLFMRDDRLGFGYGRNLSNDELRRQTGAKVPDVWEVFYDVRVSPILRAAVTLQQRNQFTETVVGFRVKTEFDVTSVLGRVFK
ncbi:hypothetical protein QT972_15730 [Microcoleus sp. herbarium7]|uniref:hypothetical protein n=1 Tax=Microcoleus sp. herbarium7 TaxID=3055435 RepID=UPI002FD631C8